MSVTSHSAGRGRPPATTQADASHVALQLFAERGFDGTTMDDVAQALGIGRRTLFRHFSSKNDLVWGEFSHVLVRLRAEFVALPPTLSLMAGLRRAAVRSNEYPAELLPELHTRLTLITTVPALQGHSMIRYAEWREVVAEYAAGRLGQMPTDFAPVAIGHAALAASMSAFAYWVAHPSADLTDLLDRSYSFLEDGFGGL